MTVETPQFSPAFVPSDFLRPFTAAEVFPDRADLPLEIDLGCGDGSFTADLADHHRDRDYWVGWKKWKKRPVGENCPT
jgi:tRNA G46 methylase TrmB